MSETETEVRREFIRLSRAELELAPSRKQLWIDKGRMLAQQLYQEKGREVEERLLPLSATPVALAPTPLRRCLFCGRVNQARYFCDPWCEVKQYDLVAGRITEEEAQELRRRP